MKWDLVILTPIVRRNDSECADACLSDGTGDVFLEQMNNILKYEVFDNVYKNITRGLFGSYTLKFFKNWPDYHCEELPPLTGNVYLAVQKVTGISICEIVISVDTDEYITYYLDAVPKDDVFISVPSKNEYVKLCDFVERFGYIQIGTPRNCVFLESMPSERKLTYILASEFFIEDDAFIESEYLRDKFKRDLCQYDFSQCYATTNCAVHIMKTFYDDYSERMYFEGMSIFLIELILFQIAAITRTNNRVVEILSEGVMPSLNTIKEINLEYAKTITLWNINIFRSTTAQVAANQMYEAFEVPKLIEQYERNQNMMEHIISIKDQIEDSIHTVQQDEENNILGVLAALTVLSALCDGFSDIDFFVGIEEMISQIKSVNIMGIIAFALKIVLLVYIIIFSRPSLSVIFRNRYKRNRQRPDEDNEN